MRSIFINHKICAKKATRFHCETLAWPRSCIVKLWLLLIGVDSERLEADMGVSGSCKGKAEGFYFYSGSEGALLHELLLPML